MKTIKTLFVTALAIATIALAFASCSSNDEPDYNYMTHEDFIEILRDQPNGVLRTDLARTFLQKYANTFHTRKIQYVDKDGVPVYIYYKFYDAMDFDLQEVGKDCVQIMHTSKTFPEVVQAKEGTLIRQIIEGRPEGVNKEGRGADRGRDIYSDFTNN